MSLSDDNPTLYRDAFRKTDELAAIIEVAPPGRLIDATDGLLSACRLDRASALGRPLDRLFNATTAARLMNVGRAAIAGRSGDAAMLDRLHPPSTRFLDRRICALRLSSDLAYLRAVESAPIQGSRRDVLLNELGALSDGLIYIYDVAQQRICYMSFNLARFLSVKPSESLRIARVARLVHRDDFPDFAKRAKNLSPLVGMEVERHSFRLLGASDGAWHQIENRYAALTRDPNGSVRSVIGCAFDITERDISHERAAHSDILFKVEDDERRRIARELHDTTAQHLVAADLMVGLHMREKGSKPDSALTSARETLGQALREIRTLSFLLHPPGGQAAGFVNFLRGFAKGFAQRSGLQLTVQIDDEEEKLSPAVELIFFRVCQEAFMNVRRHANASSVSLRLAAHDDSVVIEIEDNGVGIDDKINRGVGIESMHARLREVGGVLNIENTGNGTLVRAFAPRRVVN